MDWEAIMTNATDALHGVAVMVGGLGIVVVMFALLNWTAGGIAVLGRQHLVVRQTWPFVTMRWLGLAVWLGTLPYAIPREIDDLNDPIQQSFTLANLGGALVLFVGTARAPLRTKPAETPTSVKPLFSDPSEQQASGRS